MIWSVIMSYEPNYNDPRVRKRIRKALGFVGACVSETKPKGWSTRYIDKYLGHQKENLSKYLRSNLLTCINDRYNKDTGVCKKYIKNKTGYDLVRSLLKNKPLYYSVSEVSEITEWVKNEHKTELTTLNFTYEDKANRLWHPLQRVRKQYKKIVFSEIGLKYQYDIQCCAPTLIHQHSQKIIEILQDNKYIQGPMDLYLFALRSYLKDRKSIRTMLATEAEMSEDHIKVIINALLAGAQLSNNKKSDIYKLLDGDIARITYLKQHPYIIELRNDIKTCWDYIKPTLYRRSIINKNNKKQVLPISSKQKANTYFQLERLVLEQVVEFMKQSGDIQYFLEHDGWVCSKELDKELLIKWIKDKTGYDIQLDMDVLV
jgi:hypothetical protein